MNRFQYAEFLLIYHLGIPNPSREKINTVLSQNKPDIAELVYFHREDTDGSWLGCKSNNFKTSFILETMNAYINATSAGCDD